MTIKAFAGPSQSEQWRGDEVADVLLEVIYHRIWLSFGEASGKGRRVYRIELSPDLCLHPAKTGRTREEGTYIAEFPQLDLPSRRNVDA